MIQFLRLPLLILLSLLVVFLAAGKRKEEVSDFRIATFDLDVTPPVGTAMAYTTVEKSPELSLRCRGIVLLGAGKPIVLAAIDWIGVANEGLDRFRDALAEAAGTSRDRVALHALHQHDAPGCDFTAEKLVKELGLKGYERTEGEFHRKVIARAAEAVRAALPRARKVTHYGWGEAEVEKVASNRRLLGPDGKVRAVRYTATRDPALRAEPEGTIDPAVSLLSFWDGNQPLAVLSYYACHPQSYYRTGTPSPDFPGIARFMRGQGVPEALHVHFNGAGGDLGAGKYNDGSPENRMILAGRLADGMRKAWESTERRPLVSGDLGFSVEQVRIPLAKHLENEEALIEALRKEAPKGYFSKVDQVAYMRHWKDGNHLDLSCLSVGNTRVLHMPGELFVEYQLAAKKMRPDLKVAMAAYGEFGTGYIGTEISYSQGGYETSPSASAVGPGSEKILMRAMERLLQVGADKGTRTEPKTPKEAMAGFHVPPGFELQLVASEPQVREPIVIAYDESGFMYAAEYLKFPSHHGKSDRPDGCVRLLRDLDDDGHYETSGVFAEGLAWPTGICCWDGGVYVVSAPDLWYLKDTTGDGKADHREKVFTGFGFRNDEGTANNLFWGLDQWIYGAGSNSGGEIRRADNPESEAISISGRDFRFHPKTREFQTLPGGEQFGNAMDDWGNRFLSQNSKPAVHVVYSSTEQERNPFVAPGASKVNLWTDNKVYRASGIEPWRLFRTKLRLSEKRNYPAPSVAHDVFSGCAGLQIYRGDAYPDEYRGNLFVGDVQANVVHRRALQPKGVTFSSERTENEREFLSSTDNWFRPANLVNAPDGTLHIIDMYRETIETPDSMIPEVLEMVDFRRGGDHGRIYRLAPEGFKIPARPELGKAGIKKLVATLEHRNGWWRDTAGRLLFERNDPGSLSLLKDLLREGKPAEARLHALHLLGSMGALDEGDLHAALSDRSPRLREHGLRYIGDGLKGLEDKLASMTSDHEIRVRFQAALALGGMNGEQVVKSLGELAFRDDNDPWMRRAILSARPELALSMFQEILSKDRHNQLLEPLAFVIGARNESPEVMALLTELRLAKDGFRAEPVFSKLADGLKQAGGKMPDGAGASGFMQGLLAGGREVLKRKDTTIQEQLEAVRMLGQAPWQDVAGDLLVLLDSSRAPEVQKEALSRLSVYDHAGLGDELIRRFPGLLPAMQAEVVEVLLSRGPWTIPLLDAVEKKQIASWRITPAQWSRLSKHKDREIREKAVEISSKERKSREKVVQEYQAALKLKGDRERGRQVFLQNCASCHRHGKEGYEVGPELKAPGNRDAGSVLIQILDPNREVLGNFIQYFITLKDGRTVTGRIENETPSALTLRRAGGVTEDILRSNIQSMTSSGQSLMPEGFEEVISVESMSDLLEFLGL